MIVRRGIDLARLARTLGPLLAALLAYDVLVTAAYVSLGWQWVAVENLPLPLLGSAIALVVTLRNNAAYDRWREARALWGAVLTGSRSFARALIALTDDPAACASLVRHQVGYALALRCRLLGHAPWDALAPLLPADALAGLRAASVPGSNVPVAIQAAMARQINDARQGGAIDNTVATALNRLLSELATAQGGLERIKGTPLPRQYNQFPQVFTRVYCLLLPLGLVHDLGVLTPLGSTVIGFMFLALDRVGRDLEDPFEGVIHDVPMQAITRTIEIDLLQMIKAEEVPLPIEVVDGVLW